MKKSTQNWLLLLGFLGALTVLVAVAPKGTPKALAQPTKHMPIKGEYMRPMRTNSVPAQTGPVEIHSKVRVSQ